MDYHVFYIALQNHVQTQQINMKQKSLFLARLVCILFITAGCKESVHTPEEIQGEAIVTGSIKNREHYPQVKELTLQLPYFQKEGVSYIAPIAEDNSFYFRFQPHTQMCEVSIYPYVEHLYVQPGDSIHIEIDFKDLLNLNITGKGAELNKQLTRYTEGGGYRQQYIIPQQDYRTNEEMERILESEWKERWQRYQDFCEQHHPNEIAKRYIEEILLADYYAELFRSAESIITYGKEGMDAHRYMEKLPDAIRLFESNAITPSHFRLAENIYQYIAFSIFESKGQEKFGIEDVLAPIKDTAVEQYVFSLALTQTLKNGNDTIQFANHKTYFDNIVTHPYLRSSLLQLHQTTKNFMENPKQLSDYILYGHYPDEIKASENLAYMQPFYNLLKKHHGKMIYLEFWGTFCPPCLAEMKPLKEMRQKYSLEDIIFVSICDESDTKEEYENILNKFEMHIPGIEHYYSSDLTNGKDFRRIKQKLNINSAPYYIIFNKEGVIVNYGTLMRPSYTGTSICIDQWLEQN